MAVTINGSSGLTFNDGSSQNTAALPGMRNRIINGAMVIDQRNAGASTIANDGQYKLDRWLYGVVGAGAFTVQQSSTAPSGFTYSALHTVTTVDSTLAASDSYSVQQRIEGFNVADLGWGTASAKTATISFWVRSSVTGAFPVSVRNSAGNRSYVSTFSIIAANTWEQKFVTIAGDTSGTWLTDNNTGIRLTFDFGSGSTYQTTANTWAAGNFYSVVGAANLLATNGATFYITGVQLEAGSVATPFENRHYGQELALCQRYYTTSVAYFAGPTVAGYGNVYSLMFPVTMRAAASLTSTGGAAVGNMTTVTTSNITANGFVATANNNGTGGGSANNGWTVSAEL